MRPPIPIGTVLQNRYQLASILGQGGFARTYLAKDQGRFDELCALKEFIPSQSSTFVLEKSKELFQREAAVLYQIQHPQIPQFRATFEYNLEESPRLFLVQDYVEGKTYHELLNARKAQGYTFSESEVRSLLQQVLPVLDYIHSKGIIHRDISPDNLILRDQDQQPVLIDFGVVKEIVTRLHTPEGRAPVTTVGKLGYAPGEQLQTGRAYPSSDLYALAATAVVLLTGRESSELYDDTILSWHWQKWVAVSSGFGQILQQMLQYRPGDRYQSANEVMAALQALPQPTAVSSTTQRQSQTVSQAVAANPSLTQVRTMAVDQANVAISRGPSKNVAVIPPVTHRSMWDNPVAVGLIGIILALLTAFVSWSFVRELLQRRTLQSTPKVMVSPTALPSLSPSPDPVSYNRPLALLPDDQVAVQGILQPNQTINYVIQGEQGQQLTLNLSGQGTVMSLFGPEQEPIVQRVNTWEGTVPATGDYYIQLKPVPGVSQSSYQLAVAIANPVPATPIATPTPTPSPEPASPSAEVDVEQVRFAPGETAQRMTDRASPGRVKRYIVNARAGQVLATQVIDGTVTLDIRTPDGQLINEASKVLSWESELPVSGDYQIDVIAQDETDFTLNVDVRNLQ